MSGTEEKKVDYKALLSGDEISPTIRALIDEAIEDRSIVYEQFAAIYPTSNLSNIDTVPRITCQASDRSNMYIPSMAYIRVEGHIAKSDGSPLLTADNANVALMNGGWNLFRRPTLTYDGAPLHVPEKDLCGALANINGLGSFSEDYTKTGATASGFYPDVGNGAANNGPINTAADGAALGANVGALAAQLAPKLAAGHLTFNSGWVKRQALTNHKAGPSTGFGSSNQTLILPLRDVLGFCRDYIGPLRGGLLEFSVDRETNAARYIHAAGGPAGMKFVITNFELWIPIIRPESKVAAYMNLMIADGFQTILDYTDWRIFTLDNGNKQAVVWNPFDVARPTRVVFAMYDSTADTDQTKNACIFVNGMMKRFNVRLSGKQFPERLHEPDFADNKHGRLYHDFLATFGKLDPTMGTDHSSIVDYKLFKDLYALFCVDLTHREIPASELGSLYRLDIEGFMDDGVTMKNLICMVETEEKIILRGNGDKIEVIRM